MCCSVLLVVELRLLCLSCKGGTTSAKSYFREKQRVVENSGEGKTNHTTPPPKTVFETLTCDTIPPPLFKPCHFLRGNGTDQTNPPPIAWYVLSPPFFPHGLPGLSSGLPLANRPRRWALRALWTFESGKEHINININIFAGLSRDWMGTKILFMCFFRVIPSGGEKHIN